MGFDVQESNQEVTRVVSPVKKYWELYQEYPVIISNSYYVREHNEGEKRKSNTLNFYYLFL